MANEITNINTIALANIAKFNDQDDSDLEKFNGQEFTGTLTWAGTRGVLAGGNDGTSSETPLNVIQYKTIASDVGTSDFGDLQSARFGLVGSGSNVTLGVFAGGKTSSSNNVTDTDKITVATTGSEADFADLRVGARMGGAGGASNGTLLFVTGGRAASGRIDNKEYFTFASPATSVDAGNLDKAKSGIAASNGNSKYLIAGGYDGGSGTENVIEYHTFSTSADSSSTGTLGTTDQEGYMISSAARAVYFRGASSSAVMEFMTVSSEGNASSFGDATVARASMSGWSDGTRGEFAGGDNEGGSSTNGSDVIDKITIASEDNATDVGDLDTNSADGGGLSGT